MIDRSLTDSIFKEQQKTPAFTGVLEIQRFLDSIFLRPPPIWNIGAYFIGCVLRCLFSIQMGSYYSIHNWVTDCGHEHIFSFLTIHYSDIFHDCIYTLKCIKYIHCNTENEKSQTLFSENLKAVSPAVTLLFYWVSVPKLLYI